MSPLRVVSVLVLDGRCVRLGLADGTDRIVDLRPLLRGPVFDRVRDDDEFFRQVAVDADFGTIVWPNGADLCPDVLIHARQPAHVERVSEE